jgi:exopolysaccharide production protein ExoQ
LKTTPIVDVGRVLMPSAGHIYTMPSAPAWHFVLGWVILLPLFYLSENGNLIPIMAGPSLGADPSSSVSHMIGVGTVTLISSILIASRFSALLSICRRMKALLALPILAVISSLWSGQPSHTLISSMILLVFTVFALYVGNRFTFREQFELIILLGAVALPLSIVLAVFVPAMGTAAGWRGIFGQKQNCAAVSTLLLITALHWRGSGVYQKAFRVLYILMCCVLIVMSRSRTGWALAIIALVLSAAIWVMQKMPPKEALLILLLVLVTAVGLGYEVFGYSNVILAKIGKDQTLSQRTIIWSLVWNEIMRRPLLGYGYAAFWKGLYGPSQNVVLNSGWDVSQAQDGFLDVWLSLGFSGVAIVGILMMQSLKNAVRSFRVQDATYVRWSIVVILSTLLYNVGESSIGVLHLVWFMFLLAYLGLNRSACSAQLR